MDLAELYRSGDVRRYHANPALARHGQNLADHQCRVAQIILALHHDPSVYLLKAALTHDVGEYVVGDLPYDFKRDNPLQASQHALMETIARETICGPDPVLTDEETAWLKLADRLECVAFCISRDWQTYCNPSAGWKEATDDVLDRADALGVRAKVWDMLQRLAMKAAGATL